MTRTNCYWYYEYRDMNMTVPYCDEFKIDDPHCENDCKYYISKDDADKIIRNAIESLSAEPKWITDSKPKEDGEYIVTLDAFGHHRFIVLMHYGKPLMPNREVKGWCWYMSDSEWGDVVYDDEDILAWLSLPTPYGESEVEE